MFICAFGVPFEPSNKRELSSRRSVTMIQRRLHCGYAPRLVTFYRFPGVKSSTSVHPSVQKRHKKKLQVSDENFASDFLIKKEMCFKHQPPSKPKIIFEQNLLQAR